MDDDGELDAREAAEHAHRPPGTAPLPSWWWRLDVTWRRVIFGGLAVAVLGLFLFGVSRIVGDDGDGGVVQTEAERFVDGLSDQRVATWDALAECESEGDWAKINDPFYGGLQFTIESWQAVGGLGRADQVPRAEQIMRAELLFEEQGWNAWPNCSAQLGLG